ncbi:bifunctional demethylmenaquinone methyltransferase/2-methoxy-6-polyprenyl-1,4-benzoquinol methylase UbiE [Thiohalorhabdus sp.]|uniref:bifunctional demethylmenaquinone methyltransferase/2-methoxy-6-polyprenyl-1,4-benzoquinol methylase UbiE n=1 Tax=Thiohalorhabdus sp. TaxID=3094134 RepID=UPI002FC32A57
MNADRSDEDARPGETGPLRTDRKQDTTHFGYQEVPLGEKRRRVRGVFDSVAPSYDLMNDLMSGGLHRYWKRYTVWRAQARAGDQVLDVAGGTGDLARQFSPIVGPRGRVMVADINHEMLRVGRRRLADEGLVGNLDWVTADAEAMPLPDDRFDVITVAFGLRNMTRKGGALQEFRRLLRPGGQLLVLEFSHPVWPLKPFYDAYSFKIIPRLGQLIAGDRESYQYLVESIRQHPDQRTLAEMFADAGFERAGYTNLTGGIVALHTGFKAQA